MQTLRLEFAEYTFKAYIDAITPQIAAGARRLQFSPYNAFAQQVAVALSAQHKNLTYLVEASEDAAAGTTQETRAEVSGSNAHPAAESADLTILCDDDPDRLSQQLLGYLDCQHAHLLAPITSNHYKARPIFLISIPKSGTHLMYQFAQTLGYQAGFTCPILPEPGVSYFLEGEHSHTRATDFLGETPWHAPFANRHHPFLRSPALFIYRNPLDILVSEANWYHRDGMNVFAGYLSGLSFEERLAKLVDDPWLLGSIRDRVGAFIAWLNLPNVIPIAFEEIVGPQGGGDAETQLRLIWSLQLKLHVPGTPTELAATVFNPNSPTFHSGQINAYKQKLTPEAKARFLALPQDFMAEYGYSSPDAAEPVIIPQHAERFRRRPLTVTAVDYTDTPVMLEYGFLEHNLILFRGNVFALPWSLGPFDLPMAQPHQLANLLRGRTLVEAKQRVLMATRWVNKNGSKPLTSWSAVVTHSESTPESARPSS
jgi:hypothetical protein